MFCSTKLTKRWDVLKNHIKHCNNTCTVEDFKNLNNSITKVAIRCQYCKVPQNIIEKSKQDQHMKVCKARKADMVQGQRRQTNVVVDQTNTMDMEQTDVVVEHTNVVNVDQTNVVNKVQANLVVDNENNVQEKKTFGID